MRQRLRDWLRSERPVDPDEVVALLTVPLFEAPLVVARLADEGIDASFVPAFNVVTRTQTDADVLVRRRDATTATTVLDGS